VSGDHSHVFEWFAIVRTGLLRLHMIRDWERH
jgi:hypothetical protein